ncbi:MAG: hypothetical protein QOI31_365 [Solirubrobacterales bacterium]|jgi:hypothetical protein|nr:hypothetical protein [Solirubrobacterales bacterium]
MSNVTHIESAEITIRTAREADMADLARVAGRDTHELPSGTLLVAKVGSDVRAAISLSDGTIIADPFHRTTELVQMLKIRAGAVNRARKGHIAPRRRSRHLPLTVGRAA